VEKPELYGKYLLIDLISVGGMAEVFKAKVLGVSGFHKIVAIKRILPSFSEQKEFVNMFVDEANIAGELHHHNIAQIYDLGKIDGTYYISMELVDGKDLRAIFDRLKNIQKPIPINMAAYICEKVLAGLDYAHNKTGSAHMEMNIVHRDVSPPNILISYNGEVKLVDFGIAKAAGKISKTQAGVLKGKFGYMSPEQVRGLTVDPRSDLFSVGVVLWEMLAGKRLFVGENDYDTLEKVRHAEIENPRTYNPQAPEALADIAMKALQRDLKKRYDSAESMRRDLQQYLYKLTPPFTYHDASGWMQEIFSVELAESRKRMEEIQNIDPAALGFDIGAISRSQEKAECVAAETAQPVRTPGGEEVSTSTGEPEPAREVKESEKLRKPVNHRFAIIVAIMVCVLIIAAMAGFHILRSLGANVVELNTDMNNGALIDVKANHENVEVFFDGKKVCLTPCMLTAVGPGKHEIRFELGGYISERRDIEVKAGDALKISGEVFKPGVLKGVVMLRSDPPGAEVLLNGEKQDFLTPGVLKSVPVGVEQKLLLRLGGYAEKEITFNLERDEIKKLDEILAPVAPAVKVVTDPAGAAVLLDGQDSGLKSPAYLTGLEVGRKYVVAALLDGHELASETIDRMADQVLTLSFPLKPKAAQKGVSAAKTGTLEVKTTPSVSIYIDGKYSGRSSPASIKIEAGRHEIKLVNPDANIHSVTPVTIESGRTVSIEKIF